jgi:hypothetical protein
MPAFAGMTAVSLVLLDGPWGGRTDLLGRHQDATAILPDDPGSDFGEGRFASAIGAHEGDPLAPRNAQIDVVERLRRAETLAERTEQVSGQQMRASGTWAPQPTRLR